MGITVRKNYTRIIFTLILRVKCLLQNAVTQNFLQILFTESLDLSLLNTNRDVVYNSKGYVYLVN